MTREQSRFGAETPSLAPFRPLVPGAHLLGRGRRYRRDHSRLRAWQRCCLVALPVGGPSNGSVAVARATLGLAIVSWLTQRVIAGGAAGIGAAFNTPLAGIVFAIEELSRSFEERTSGTIYSAVIVAGVTSVALVGNYTYFGSTQASLTDPRMWVVVPACGIAGVLDRRREMTQEL